MKRRLLNLLPTVVIIFLCLTLSGLPVTQARRTGMCITCHHLDSEHDAAGWCLVPDASGDGYADTCMLYKGGSAQMWSPPPQPNLDQTSVYLTLPETTCPPSDPGFRALLGGADYTDGVHYSPMYHIPYYPRGFDGDVTKKKVTKKTPNYFLSVGVPQEAVDAFKEYSLQFVTTIDHDAHGIIGQKIDAAWTNVVQTFRACGPGSWPYNAVNAGIPFIAFEEKPFSVCSSTLGNVWAVGQVASDRSLKICIGHLTDYLGDPTHATYIRTIDSLIRWEMANSLAKAAGYVFCTAQDEAMVQNPCGVAIRTHCP